MRDLNPIVVVASADDNDSEKAILMQLYTIYMEDNKNLLKKKELFGRLSSEGVKKAKEMFKGFTSGATIDKVVACAKIGYPEHMINKPGIKIGVWKLLSEGARKLAQNQKATVDVRVAGQAAPIVKTIESLTGPEISMVFRIGYPGACPPCDQFPVPPKNERVNSKDLEGYEEADSIIPTGTEYVIIHGKEGGKMKCHFSMLRNIRK